MISLLLTSCSLKDKSTAGDNIFVTEKVDLDKNMGKFIIIKGEIQNSKTPTIIGVDVSIKDVYEEFGDVSGKIGMACGILLKTIVTDADPYSTNRGNGTFYRIKDPKSDSNSEVVIDLDDN
jgi:hypothetical protein